MAHLRKISQLTTLYLLGIITAYSPTQVRSEPATKLTNILENTADPCIKRSGYLTTKSFHFSFTGLRIDDSSLKRSILEAEISVFSNLIAKKYMTDPIIRVFDQSGILKDPKILLLVVASATPTSNDRFFEGVVIVELEKCIFRVRTTGLQENVSTRDQFAQLIMHF